MKTKTNILKTALYLFLGTALLSSCSKDEENTEPGPSGGVPEIGFVQEPVKLPDALLNNTNPKAQELNLKVQQVNSYTIYSSFLLIPFGQAEVSHEPITPGSAGKPGRKGGMADYTVYTYNYGEIVVAYQYSIQNGKEVVEIFIDDEETTGFMKFLEIIMKPDGTSGEMKLFSEGAVVVTWTWQKDAAGGIFITMQGPDFRIELQSNADLSGYMDVYEEGTLMVKFTWNADGSGTATNVQTGETVSWQ